MTLAELLRESAHKYPDKPALIFNGQTWTYKELERRVLAAAKGFEVAGINQRDRVVLLLKNSPEFAVSVFALSWLGATAVPVNFFLTAQEIAFICEDCKASALITQNVFMDRVPAVREAYKGLKRVWLTDPQVPFPAGIEPFERLYFSGNLGGVISKDEDIALLIYTSGTTGKPKGVMLTEYNVTSNAEASISMLGLNGKDRFLCILPMFHAFAWTANIVVPIRLGCLIVLVESIRPPKPWLKLMGKHGITIFAAVPQIFAVLAEQAVGFKRLVLKYIFFRKVRFGISGAAPLQLETQQKFESRLGVPILQGYGLTETSPVVSVNMRRDKPGSVGQPVQGVKVKIIDELERELPPGTEGEICVKGTCVMKGYYEQPAATKEAFTKDGWFKTGDVGLLDKEGSLYIRDRIKDMIIVKGLKVFSVQIEDLLLTHPAVAEAAVVGIPDASTGDETIKGFVVLKEGAQADKSELLKYCQEKLPAYKRPRDIVIRESLPKNALQKVLKRELRNEKI